MNNHPFEGFNGDPSRGMPLRFALTYYADAEMQDFHGRSLLHLYQILKERVRLPQVFKQPFTAADLSEMQSYERMFLQDLLDRLHAGTLVAKGYTAAGQLARTTVPADWWTRVHFDLPDNSAEKHGTRVLDILIFPGEEANASPASGSPEQAGAAVTTYSTGSPGAPTSQHLFMQEFRARHAGGKLASKVSAEARHLSAWLMRSHPNAQPATAKTIENHIRAEFRVLKNPPELPPESPPER